MNKINNPFLLEGKTILVTGASSGIGQEVAIQCSKMGASLIITGRNKERLEETYNRLDGDNHIFVSADLNSCDDRVLILDRISKIDGILHAAGIMGTLPFKFASSEKMEEIMKTNFFSPILFTKELVSSKKINKGASIVFISSIASKHSYYGNGLYAATKGAINSISRVMALELSAQKIRVNCILPAMVESGIEDRLGSISQHDFEVDKAKYPLGYGQPVDVANASIFFLSDASKWITGTELIMDGGFTLL